MESPTEIAHGDVGKVEISGLHLRKYSAITLLFLPGANLLSREATNNNTLSEIFEIFEIRR